MGPTGVLPPPRMVQEWVASMDLAACLMSTRLALAAGEAVRGTT